MDLTSVERSQRQLQAAAADRMAEALNAWLEEDFDRAAASAPMAVELLAKAALWNVHPTLLVPLEVKQEAALVALATEPSLDSPTLRTIGLRIALGRLTKILGELPVPASRQALLIDCRNGSLHVGTLPTSGETSAESVARQVLADSLALCDRLTANLGIVSADLYGAHVDLAAGLLQQRRTEAEHRLARMLAKARLVVERWREHLEDEDAFVLSAEQLEGAATDAFPPEDFGDDLGAVDQECPVCGYLGRLLGRVDVEGDVEVHGGADGPEYYGYWRLTLCPRHFLCNVCKLVLSDAQQLDMAGIPAHNREVRETELGDSFSAAQWAEALYGTRD